jgi:uncharacterized protein HemY
MSSYLVYQFIYDCAIPIDRPTILLELGKLSMGMQDLDVARGHLEEAFRTSPVHTNHEIRLTLCELYKKLGAPKLALQVIQNPTFNHGAEV